MVDMKRMLGVLGQAPMQQQMPQPEQKKPGFGDILSDFVINYGAASGNPLASGIIQNRMREQQQAAAQQAQEQLYNRKRTDSREDQQWAWENKPKTPHRWESNDGSLMELGADGKPRVAYQDPTPKINYQRVPNADGTFTMVPIPMTTTPTRPVGKLKPIGSPNINNTAPPALGQNGIPQTLTRQQYMATVNAMGKEKTDAWIARNNVKVGQ